jgi:hypothetical protein
VTGILKRQKSSRGRLDKIEHGPLVGQKVSELALAHFGFGEQSNHVGQITQRVQEFSIKLLGIDDIKDASVLLKRLQFFINGFADEFFPSFEFLFGLFGVFLHFFSPARVVGGFQLSPVISSGRWMQCGE